MYEIEIRDSDDAVVVTFRTNYMPNVFDSIQFMRKARKHYKKENGPLPEGR